VAWEARGGGRYYYRVVRDGGRVRRLYLGNNPVAELAARDAELRRAERQARAHSQGRLEAAEAVTRELAELTDLLARAALVVAGYHRHDRGAWRKRRERPGRADRG
jgi:hypothetical protein